MWEPNSHCAVSSSQSSASATGKLFTMQITHLAGKQRLGCTDSHTRRDGETDGELPPTQSFSQPSTLAERRYSRIWTTTACL